jgi:hypothetical protein
MRIVPDLLWQSHGPAILCLPDPSGSGASSGAEIIGFIRLDMVSAAEQVGYLLNGGRSRAKLIYQQ